MPAGQNAQARVEPIWETFEGWSQSTRGARKWADLPAQAVKYVRNIEELIETLDSQARELLSADADLDLATVAVSASTTASRTNSRSILMASIGKLFR